MKKEILLIIAGSFLGAGAMNFSYLLAFLEEDDDEEIRLPTEKTRRWLSNGFIIPVVVGIITLLCYAFV